MEFELEEVVSLIRVGFKEPFGERLLLILEEVCVGMNLVPMEHTRPFKAKVCITVVVTVLDRRRLVQVLKAF